MAKGNARKTSQVKASQKASEAISLPPGLAPPPGLPTPSASQRKKGERYAKQLAGHESAQPLVRPPGLESIAEDAIMPIKVDATEDDETSSSVSPMYIESSISTPESTLDTLEAIPSEIYQVQLLGLPNEILCDAMFEVVLQQARLNGHYSGYRTTPGESTGEAVVDITNESAAEWCLQHFRSCSWGVGGTMLGAEIISKPSSEQVGELFEEFLFAGFQPGPLFQEGKLDGELDESDGVESALYTDNERLTGLSSHALPFVPGARLSAEAPEFVMSAMTGGLSAGAQEFVPGQLTEKIVALSSKFANTSDVSTVDGDSEVDSEKEAAH
jgi:hypothetical protein